ncbi:MAG: hypothetical protein EBU46_20205, partial [Nitrosomonadaceae bacterium]|nr:hypothetical protein [Nitrosomonadaceae bacterium]
MARRAHLDTAPEERNFPERGCVAETSRSGCAWLEVLRRYATAPHSDVAAADPAPSGAADKLVWRSASERVDADIDGWSLPQLLEHLAEVTGWQVFVEPGTSLKAPVSVKFSNLAPAEALGRMLGGLSFAVLPQANASAKLFVFRTSVADATQAVRPPGAAKAKPIADELVLLR